MENLSSVFGIEDENAVRICAGDFFPSDVDTLKERYLLRMAQALKFTAFLPGDADFPLINALNSARIPILLANVELKDGTPVPKYIVTKFEGKSIAFIGLWSESTFNLLPDSLKRGSIYRSADACLKDVLGQLPENIDIIIVITQGLGEFERKLTEKFPAVDLVINGGRNTGKNLPIRSGDGYIITTGKGSEAMVRFELETPSVSRAGFEVKDYLNLPLFQYDPPALPDFKIMVDNYYEEWFRLLDARRKGRGEADKVFLGNKFCAKCHQKQYQLWISSAHSKAYEVLLKPVENRCLVCHTTGFEYPTGFYDLELSPGLAGIGCEECHYFKKIPGKEDEHIVPEMNEKSCRCHIAPYDPDFNFKCSTLKVKH